MISSLFPLDWLFSHIDSSYSNCQLKISITLEGVYIVGISFFSFSPSLSPYTVLDWGVSHRLIMYSSSSPGASLDEWRKKSTFDGGKMRSILQGGEDKLKLKVRWNDIHDCVKWSCIYCIVFRMKYGEFWRKILCSRNQMVSLDWKKWELSLIRDGRKSSNMDSFVMLVSLYCTPSVKSSS